MTTKALNLPGPVAMTVTPKPAPREKGEVEITIALNAKTAEKLSQAANSYGRTRAVLAERLLRTICKDDLFSAVLDD